MGGGRGEQVAAADDVAHLLQRVVDDDGEMVARSGVAAAQHEIAPAGRLGALGRVSRSPSPSSRQSSATGGGGQRARHIEPPGGRLARRQPRFGDRRSAEPRQAPE